MYLTDLMIKNSRLRNIQKIRFAPTVFIKAACHMNVNFFQSKKSEVSAKTICKQAAYLQRCTIMELI